ncbi:hypothetical protein I551_3436 [Mycobacterium ulcerans str. Harvey]|uniref:PPE family protein n=1 Tax=Mycobacterium ulcerans str. Harvey TaxID=1299332 RepID=A0ABP3AK70_MYCUL|nr:hypothetical protein I551_3436 [Mycobacterium ulcerans str. Harvey]
MNAAAPAATAAQAAELPPDRQSQFLQWLKDIGYVDLYNKLIKPFVDWLANIPFLQALFSGFDPYLLTLGNPLTYLSPLNIAFALGYPMDFATYVTLLSQTFAFIGADLAAAFASGNPMTIGLTILFTSVEAIGTIITDTIALLKTLLEQTAVLLAALAPMLAAPLVPLAAGAVLVPLGAKGLAALVAVPPPALPVAAPAAPPVALTPTSRPLPGASTRGREHPYPHAGPAATAVDRTTAGKRCWSGSGDGEFRLHGGWPGRGCQERRTCQRPQEGPRPDGAEVPVVAPAPSEPARSQRRRRTKVGQLGRGFEYMDLESETTPDSMTGSERITTASGLAGSAGLSGSPVSPANPATAPQPG